MLDLQNNLLNLISLILLLRSYDEPIKVPVEAISEMVYYQSGTTPLVKSECIRSVKSFLKNSNIVHLIR